LKKKIKKMMWKEMIKAEREKTVVEKAKEKMKQGQKTTTKFVLLVAIVTMLGGRDHGRQCPLRLVRKRKRK